MGTAAARTSSSPLSPHPILSFSKPLSLKETRGNHSRDRVGAATAERSPSPPLRFLEDPSPPPDGAGGLSGTPLPSVLIWGCGGRCWSPWKQVKQTKPHRTKRS